MKIMKRSSAIGLLSSVPLAVPRRARAQRVAAIRVAAAPSDAGTALIYAIESGSFRKRGLEISLQPAMNGAAMAAAIVGGSIDVASSSLMSLINSYVRGIRFKIVAGGVSYTAGESYLELSVLKSSRIATLADASGKTVATSALRSLEALGSAMLIDQNGGDSSTVKFIEGRASAMQAMLEQGATDIVAIYEPFLEEALETGHVRTLGNPYGAIGKRLVISGWFCSEEYLGKNKALMERFNEALREAAVYTNAHHAETAPLVARYTRIDVGVIKRMTRLNAATSVEPGDIQPAIDAAAKYKYIDGSFSAKELLAG